jgi:hypothetical protein
MTFEPQEVSDYLARKAEQQRDSDLRLLFDIARYTSVGLVVLLLLDLMIRLG